MLRFLAVRNLAVIESLEVEFAPGLTVLTGETGAGKSILVEAVGLLLGGRASPDLIRTGEDQAILQAVFETDAGEELLVRREITQQGRSRAFVNGALATAATLKTLGERLVDLHGQHDHQALLDPHTHLDVLDAFGGLAESRASVAATHATWQQAVHDLAEARRAEREKTERLDLLGFQLGELTRARLRAGEDEELAAARQILASADRVQRLCVDAYSLLYEQDDAVLAGLGTVWKRVAELASIDPRFGGYLEARDAIKPQLEDLAAFLRSYASGLDASPARLQEVEDRLALVERMKRKYGPTLSDALERQAALANELEALERAGERVKELEQALAASRERYLHVARQLSAARRAFEPQFAARLISQLRSLALERTRFEVRFERELPEGEWGPHGVDAAEFFVSPNPGEDLRPLARVASGGELSRLVLALKTVASADRPGKTLIFDEVDAGIGGRVADAVGKRLKALGRDFQVLCITHLPQIAAHGGTHFHISKCVKRGRTLTVVERLDTERRVAELARMLGGATVTAATIAGAREILEDRQGESERKTKGESESRQ